MLIPALQQPVQAQSIEDEALSWLQGYLRVDTINPPSNESRAVDYIAAILDSEGIASFRFDPRISLESEISRVHGNDERVGVAAFRRGAGDLRAIISEVVFDP